MVLASISQCQSHPLRIGISVTDSKCSIYYAERLSAVGSQANCSQIAARRFGYQRGRRIRFIRHVGFDTFEDTK